MKQYCGTVRVTELKFDKKGGNVDEEIFQLMDIGPFCARSGEQWKVLHTRAQGIQHPLELGKTYKFYHSCCEVFWTL